MIIRWPWKRKTDRQADVLKCVRDIEEKLNDMVDQLRAEAQKERKADE